MVEIQVQCIDSEVGFVGCRADWEDLWGGSVQASYFLSHDWFRCCWQELRSTNELRVFIVREGGRPILIAPLMRSRARHKRLPVNSLRFIEHPETQLADFIFRSVSEGERAAVHLMRYLLKHRFSDWDMIALDKIRMDSPTRQILHALQAAIPIHCQLEASHEALVIPLGDSWEDYLGAQSVRFRKTLRNVVNRMRRLGKLELTNYQGRESWAEALQKLFSVSDASWKLSNGVAITSSSERMRFFEDLLKGAATAGGLRILVLEADGIPIASETQILDGPTVYALRSDYDERYADSSPGTYLQMEILKELFAGSFREYNLGIGVNPYKTRWAQQRSSLCRFRLFNQTFYSRLLRSVDRVPWAKITALPGLRVLNGLMPGKAS